MTTHDQELQAITERAEKATPGPWQAGQRATVHKARKGDLGTYILAAVMTEGNNFEQQNAADADFIAHAREDIPTLLTEVRYWRDETSRSNEQRAAVLAENDDLKRRISRLRSALTYYANETPSINLDMTVARLALNEDDEAPTR